MNNISTEQATIMRLDDVAAMLPGAKLVGSAEVKLARVHTDTRTLAPGDLFVALRGERFDANDFLADAKAKGAVAAVAEHGLQDAGLPGVLVADGRIALGQLAAGWRKRFDIPLIAVTGSNGKTTVTQMLGAILAVWHGEPHRIATLGSFNNDVGLPLTLLRLRAQHRAAAVELGMNHRGEIDYLARIASPTVALVNNAQREHMEFMDSVEATAIENGQVFGHLRAGGVAVFPADDAHAAVWRRLAAGHRQVSFALQGSAEVTATVLQDGDMQRIDVHSAWGEFTVRLPLAGRHNAHNALAAASCALAAGAPIEAVVSGLERYTPAKGRLVRHFLQWHGVSATLVDDTYNANPDSVRAAIDVLAAMPAPRWMVLGDMGEVGDQGPQFHAEVGAYARERGIDRMFTLGSLSEYSAQAFSVPSNSAPHANHYAHRAELALALKQAVMHDPWASMLIKGSRFMAMEEFVTQILNTVLNNQINNQDQKQVGR
jgi:UDP-N-acetylmuramoyl-tripeptide--D-alanyl-D-alanine ligase